MKTRAILLAVDSGLPTEFRLFTRGWNQTENGRYLFDDAAAQSVMAAYKNWGVDLAIDLEHQMLEVGGGDSPDPTARDARGWCKLELRPDGSLWAVQVRWTPDGAERLEQKRQRYISPAFECDRETKRVTKIINVAITAMPATHKTPALVAASKGKGKQMDPSLVKQALEAIEKGDAKAALDILKGLVASAAGAEPEPDGDEDGSEGDGAEGVAPPAEEKEAVEDPKVVDASKDPSAAAPEGPNDGDGSDDEDDGEEKPAKKAAYKAMSAMLLRTTGKSTLAEALNEVEIYKASHLTAERDRQQLAKERATLESEERRKLVAELVRLGAEFPATVWADAKSKKLKARWANLPIVELRSHVAEQREARGVKKAPSNELRPANDSSSDSPAVAALSAAELAICEQTKCDPKDFAALKAFRDGKKG